MTAKELYNLQLKRLMDDGVIVEPKASKWYWKAIAAILFVLSFGKIRFMETSVTTIGKRIGTPVHWENVSDELKYEILSHEAVHIKQYKRFGFGNIWVGVIPVGIAYLFLPLPIGLACGRARFEQEAYEQNIGVMLRLYGYDATVFGKDYIVKQFTSANYLWMWPFKAHVEKWFDEAVERIAQEEGIKNV